MMSVLAGLSASILALAPITNPIGGLAAFAGLTAGNTHEEAQHATTKPDVSFSPMALPLIAGPGSIGVVIALAARNTAIGFHVGIVLGIAVTAAIIALLLRYGTPWIDKLGATGVGAIVRIMGFLILVIGVELIIHGVRALQLF